MSPELKSTCPPGPPCCLQQSSVGTPLALPLVLIYPCATSSHSETQIHFCVAGLQIRQMGNYPILGQMDQRKDPYLFPLSGHYSFPFKLDFFHQLWLTWANETKSLWRVRCERGMEQHHGWRDTAHQPTLFPYEISQKPFYPDRGEAESTAHHPDQHCLIAFLSSIPSTSFLLTHGLHASRALSYNAWHKPSWPMTYNQNYEHSGYNQNYEHKTSVL